MIRLTELTQITSIMPSQWSGRTDDARPVYIHYKHGMLSVRVGMVGGAIDDAVGGEEIFWDDVGEKHGCMLDWDEAAAATGIEFVP